MPLHRARFRISEYNEQRKAKLKHKERSIRVISLSLTSMVDMFAILVIYLLTSSSTVSQWMEVGHGIELPRARTSDVPPKAANIQISSETIFGGEKELLSIKNLAHGSEGTIPQLKAWITSQPQKGGYVNIVGDTHVPFGVIRRVIATCQEAGFGNVNLAVQPKAGSVEG